MSHILYFRAQAAQNKDYEADTKGSSALEGRESEGGWPCLRLTGYA
jgi:hypothetical protein